VMNGRTKLRVGHAHGWLPALLAADDLAKEA
jgi:hypothetical protein